MSRVHDVEPDHFHTTNSTIYVSYLDPVDGQLRLRVYLVNPGGELEEWRYPKPPAQPREWVTW